MFKFNIISILFLCLFIAGCNKENGKHEYEMQLLFDSGDIFTEDGKIFEKFRKNKKYQEQIKDGYSIKYANGKSLYIEVFNGYIFLKVDGNKFVCSDKLFLKSETPVAFANGMSGSFVGDIYFEGDYTQKGRAYTVDNGYFEFIWLNESTGQPMNSIVYTGKWTLKRK